MARERITKLNLLNHIMGTDYRSSISRFWFPILFAIAFAVFSIYLIESNAKFYEKPLLVCSLGFLLGINASLVIETLNLKKYTRWLPFLLVSLLLVLYYFSLSNAYHLRELEMVRHFGLCLVLHLSISYIPYLNNRSTASFWNYNQKIFARFFTSAFFTLIIFLGLALAILAMEYLFGISSRKGKNYTELFIILSCVFHPIFFLSGFPKNFDDEGEQEIHASFRTLVIYILIPISLLYVAILFAYTLKILGQQSLPKGWVSKLVLSFSIIGILTYLLNYMLPEKLDNRGSKFFKKYFFLLLLLPLGLLFVAIYVRISEYGVTEPRYIVAMLASWILLVSSYIIISKKDNIKFLPISMSVLILVSIFGPLNMFKTSEKSQLRHLLSSLTANGMLVDEKLKPAKEISPKEAQNISSKLYYLTDKRRLSLLQPYSSSEVNLNEIDSIYTNGSFGDYNFLLQKLNLKSSEQNRSNASRKYLEIHAILDEPMPIDTFSHFTFFKKNAKYSRPYAFQQIGNSMIFTYAGNDENKEEIDFSKFLNEAYAKNERQLDIDKMSVSFQLKNTKVKVFFTKLTFEEKAGNLKLINHSGYLFIN